MMDREIGQLLRALVFKKISRRDFITKATALGLSIGAVGSILAACGGGTATPAATETATSAATGTATAAATETATAASTETATATATAASATGSGKATVLRFAEAWPTYIDPAVGLDYASGKALLNLYDPLVWPTPEGDVKPWLAEKWDVASDGLKYTFYLKKGVKFHSGEELTADDVVFSMERLLTIGEGFSYLYKPYVDKVTAVDTYTVEFALKKPFGPFLLVLPRFSIASKKVVMANMDKAAQTTYGDNGDYGKKWLLTNDAGSGPYTVKEFKLEEYYLTEKFGGYWQTISPDAPDGFKCMATSEAATIRTLMGNKELEICDQWQSNESFAALAKIQGVEVANLPGNIMYLMLHTRKPPTDDVNFRQALTYAIDYEAAIGLFDGSKPTRGAVQPDLAGIDDSIPYYKRDLAKAKDYLSKSKYADQLDQSPVDLVWVAEVPTEEQISLLVQANAAEIGIKVNVLKTPWGKVIEMLASEDSTPNGTLMVIGPQYAEAGSMLEERFHSSSAGSVNQAEWLKDPEIDKAIEDSLTALDKDQRFAKYKTIQQKLMEIAPCISLYQGAERHAYWKQYVDWPAANDATAAKPVSALVGFAQWIADLKMYPDKM